MSTTPMFASACLPMRSTPAQHAQHGTSCCRILKLAVVAIIYLASAAAQHAGLTGTKSSAADGKPSSLNFHEGSTGGQQRALLNAQSRPAAVVRRSDGTLRLAEAPEGQKRPFKMAFYYDFDPAESPDVVEYIQETLVPAAASLLGRWIRVRNPAGPLSFGSLLDLQSQPIPAGPDGNGAYDTDIVFKVNSNVPIFPFCGRTAAIGNAVLFEPLTRRPIFGQLRLCNVKPTDFLTNTLQFVLHELLHTLGFQKDLFQTWQGARDIQDVVRTVTAAQAPSVVGPQGIGLYRAMITPNALREARAHFGCPQMEGVLMEERGLEVTEHWSMRHYNGALLRAGFTGTRVHYGREAMTDITLGALQDTGWYDVKYGSGGFNPYGYKAGCAFVSGTFEETLADAVAGRFLCSPDNAGTVSCFSDFSGQAVCNPQRRYRMQVYDDLYTVDLEYDGGTKDCQASNPGARCINESDDDGAGDLICQPDFSCSGTGQVLIEGLVCAEFVSGCPPDELMCGDPGLLTCATPALNDCNGRGACRQGRCFCHIGWGGDDCTVPVCTTGCPDGSACPASGFCGVPECGQWSTGDTGKGSPCTSN